MSTPTFEPATAERRATLLHAAARVCKNVTSILDPDLLLRETVNIICDEFQFYYAGVFLIDASGRWAVLRAGYGEAGAAMIAEGHRLAVGGDSMIGWATGRRQARIANNVGDETVHFKNPHLPGTRSEMALPLVAGRDIIGALTVQSTQQDAFTQEDIATLQTMADQLAIAIQNARLHQENQNLLKQAQRRARLLRAENQVGHRATLILDLDELLPKTVDIICDAYDVYYAGIFLIDASGRWAVLRAGRGAPGAAMIAQGHQLAVGGDSMIGAATGRREARIALDVGREAIHFKNPHLHYTRSEMALPLIVGDKVLGAVTIQSVEERAFSDDDITSLQTMADHLAIAIHNAQLLDELERAHVELLRSKTYEALATATTQAIHWIGNKALPITSTVARMQADLASDHFDAQSLREDLALIAEGARLIVQVKENLIGPAREHRPRPALLADVAQAAAFHAGVPAERLAIRAAAGAPLALADTTQLARALSNLFKNALEASAHYVRVDIAPADEPGYVSLRITDDGVGIPAENLAKVWAAFFTTKSGAHSGLGLPACLHVITQLDGRIVLESDEGRGATATIVLPAADRIPRADLSAAPDHVWLIDDDDAWSQFAAETLTAAGKKVTRQTVLGNSSGIDVVLIDETLQEGSIVDAIDAVRAAGLADRTLVVSAAPSVERATAHLQAGVKDVRLKPYTPGELAAILT